MGPASDKGHVVHSLWLGLLACSHTKVVPIIAYLVIVGLCQKVYEKLARYLTAKELTHCLHGKGQRVASPCRVAIPLA